MQRLAGIDVAVIEPHSKSEEPPRGTIQGIRSYTVNGQKCDVLHLGKNASLLAVQGIKPIGCPNEW
jgi:hypothetical protein